MMRGSLVCALAPDIDDGAAELLFELAVSPDLSASTQIRQALAGLDLPNLYGPAQVLYCAPATFRDGERRDSRRVDDDDRAAVGRFMEELGPADWQLGDPRDWSAAHAVFASEDIVSLAAVRSWGGKLGEVLLGTVPAARRQGLARAVARSVTAWLLEETTLIPQYDAALTNTASLRIAAAVGYQPYGVLVVAGAPSSEPG
jgi:RimJ/RimL family protein N-acetyltransferase